MGTWEFIPVDVLMNLQRAVPCGGQEDIRVECQLKSKIRHLILRVVGDVEIIGVGLNIILRKAKVIRIINLAPCAASRGGRYRNVSVLCACRGKQFRSRKGLLESLPVVCRGMDDADRQADDTRYQRDDE